jgi:hypothetical protein
MKNTNMGLFFVSILLSSIYLNGCASNQAVNGEAKSPSPNGLPMEFMRTDIPIDRYSYLALKENIHFLKLDNIPAHGDRAVIIPSGEHIITIRYFTGASYTDPILMRFIFEPGKCYYLDYEYKRGEFLKSDEIEPIISDIPDLLLNDAQSNFERARLFFEWYTANSAALDGTWLKEKGTILINKIRITITGDEFKIILPFGFYTGNVEGRLCFDQNWIVLYPTRHYSTKNESGEEFSAPFTFQPAWLNKEILYYEHTGDSLSITSFSGNSNFFLNKKPVVFKKE